MKVVYDLMKESNIFEKNTLNIYLAMYLHNEVCLFVVLPLYESLYIYIKK